MMQTVLTLDKVRTYRPIVSRWWARWWPAAVCFLGVLLAWNHYFTLVFNASTSLPFRGFIVLKQERNVHRGDFAAFPWERDRPYPRGLSFVKQVAGVPGDEVIMTADRRFFVRSQPSSTSDIPGSTESKTPVLRAVGKAKTHGSVGNMAGVPLEAGFTGVIPPGYLYMYAWAPDSLDSRYALLGLVRQDKIIGRAVPFWPIKPSANHF